MESVPDLRVRQKQQLLSGERETSMTEEVLEENNPRTRAASSPTDIPPVPRIRCQVFHRFSFLDDSLHKKAPVVTKGEILLSSLQLLTHKDTRVLVFHRFSLIYQILLFNKHSHTTALCSLPTLLCFH
eukprot:TRINITY_DN3120_c0_g1_i1.p1 TRINITY_DN3120_c0_g1~~TRINITY_DN3120_c0_g1_i1.p1  ORF type:complete len:128 (+),score=27.04 TRINITY_DN3120_c0_g1_i1:154-537(+)